MNDLNKLLAEWLGWKQTQFHYGCPHYFPGDEHLFIPHDCFPDADEHVYWNPLESHDQIHRYLLPKVAELGLEIAVIEQLEKLNVFSGWEILTASAPDICQAIAQAAGLMKEGV